MVEGALDLGPLQVDVDAPASLADALTRYARSGQAGGHGERARLHLELVDAAAHAPEQSPPLPCRPDPNDPSRLVVDSPWFDGHIQIGQPLWTARLRPLDPDAPPVGLERRVFSMLRMLTCMSVTARGGIALHGATVVKDGRATVFVGPRRAGKTTLVRRFSSGYASLGDDLALLLPSASGFVAHGSPFTGRERTEAASGSAPLARVCVLKQGERTVAEPMSTADATRELLRRAFLHVDAASERRRVMDAALRVTAAVAPVLRLSIHLDTSPWTLEALS